MGEIKMRHEQMKVVKIIAELNTFFLALGADHINSGVVKDGRHGTITFRANYDPRNKDQLRDLEKNLNQQRNGGIEEIYWGLAGSGNFTGSDQLLLVGTMIDRAEVEFEDGYVNLTMYKELEG